VFITPTPTPTPLNTALPTPTRTPYGGHPSYINLACPTPPCFGTPIPSTDGHKTAIFSQEAGACTQQVYCQHQSPNATPVPLCTPHAGDGYCNFKSVCYAAECAVVAGGDADCVASCWIEHWSDWTKVP
jgi:hypothetical protein